MKEAIKKLGGLVKSPKPCKEHLITVPDLSGIVMHEGELLLLYPNYYSINEALKRLLRHSDENRGSTPDESAIHAHLDLFSSAFSKMSYVIQNQILAYQKALSSHYLRVFEKDK